MVADLNTRRIGGSGGGPADRRWRLRRRGIALVVAGMVAASCGGGGGSDESGGGPGDEGEPQRGGRVVYALEAETNGGYCLPEAQLAISGIQVARSIYDTLTAPDENGDMQPLLAESVEPNDTFDEWTITLREGVKFHDGTDLNAEVVKNNLDAYRGQYEARSSLLFTFVLDNIDTVEATDDLTVTVTTATPWPAFPAFLYNDARLGIMGQAQLDNPDQCDKELVGTGPFQLKEWKPNDSFVAEKNPDYWQEGADGEPLPYLDEIEFQAQPELSQRIEGLQTGAYDVAHMQGGEAESLAQSAIEGGQIELVINSDFAEVSYLLFNTSEPPFDDKDARLAVTQALDVEEITQLRTEGRQEVATGPFGPGSIGYLEDAGQAPFDLEAAKEHAAAYKEKTGDDISFAVPYAGNAEAQASAELYQSQLAEAGIEMKLQPIDQAAEIDRAIAGDFQGLMWRNHPGGDPDQQYVWWHTGSPVNFGRLDDPEIDRLLEAGRVESDPEARTEIYQDLNRQFSEGAYNVWVYWTKWGVASVPGVGGVLGPDVNGAPPFTGLATGHPVSGMWIAP